MIVEVVNAFVDIFKTVSKSLSGDSSFAWLAVFGILCWLIADRALDKKADLEERKKLLEHILKKYEEKEE